MALTDQEKVTRAGRARQLLNDPMIKEFIQNMRQTVYQNIESSKWNAVDEREKLYLQLCAVADLERQFRLAMDDGKLAQSRLETFKQKIGI